MAHADEKTKTDISTSIRDLFGEKDRYFRIDLDVLTTEISDYVFKTGGESNEANRYEIYYQLLGKAVAIAQGWKHNCSETVELPSQTQASIKDYLANTYGTKCSSQRSESPLIIANQRLILPYPPASINRNSIFSLKPVYSLPRSCYTVAHDKFNMHKQVASKPIDRTLNVSHRIPPRLPDPR